MDRQDFDEKTEGGTCPISQNQQFSKLHSNCYRTGSHGTACGPRTVALKDGAAKDGQNRDACRKTAGIVRHGAQMREISRTRCETLANTLELTIDIEELETKIAPDGGETVLPLPSAIRHR